MNGEERPQYGEIPRQEIPQGRSINQKLVVGIAGAAVLAIAGIAGAYFFFAPEADTGQTACTQEAKLCPDGVTYVSRTSPNCEFAACPDTETSMGTSDSSISLTTGWKTYRNEELGFELQYPTDRSLGFVVSTLNTEATEKFAIRLEGVQVFEVRIYDKGNFINAKDWADKNMSYNASVVPFANWMSRFTASAQSTAFSQIDGGGKSGFYVWAEQKEHIFFLLGSITEANLQILSTFKFTEPQ